MTLERETGRIDLNTADEKYLVAALVTRETWGRAERDEVEALERAIRAEVTEPTPRRTENAGGS